MAPEAPLFAFIPLFARCGAYTCRLMSFHLPFLIRPPRIAVIRLQGVIASAGRGRLNDSTLAPVIERAFRRRRPAAVALVINSPGGSPVQSSLIAARIRRLAEKRKIPVHAFVEDVAASGGYWLAAAADDIWLDESSIIGSIGVISAGFGLHEFITRHGIERRLYTAGRSKSMLDPFLPEKPADVKRLRRILEGVHENFIAHVKARRGARLADDPALFTGEIWVGRKGIEVGLADGIGHLEARMRQVYGDNAKFMRYGVRPAFLRRLGIGMLDGAADRIEERAEYARYGL